jgi:spectinomycin phosphotransferase/16S rRNA (guanine(1405)-N(7))-methyltransferase
MRPYLGYLLALYRRPMLSPPDGFSEGTLVSVLRRNWDLRVASMDYQAVGFGSHHWIVLDPAGTRWFVTVDELETKRHFAHEPLTSTFDRLRHALAAAQDLRACGSTFVVAPLAARNGEPVAWADDRLAVALYPFVDGESFECGEFATPAHRRSVLDLVIAVHRAPRQTRRHALVDDFSVPHRQELEVALRSRTDRSHLGPYAGPTSALLSQNAPPLHRLLTHYDGAVEAARTAPTRTVLTHGEPHPGNTMLTADGWRLIDWDTTLVAQPERDLWSLDAGDGSVLEAYHSATGVRPLPAMLALYRLRWDLAEIAVYVSRFHRPHSGNVDDDKSWDVLRSLVGILSS